MTEGNEGSLIRDLKIGDEQAANSLWNAYFQTLVAVARAKLEGLQGRETAAEDVALSALKSLCLGARRGNFAKLSSQENLWPLLLVITSRKAAKLKIRERRQKRGGGKQVTAADLNHEEFSPLDQILSREPTPDFAVAAAENCDRLLGMLNDESRVIALAKMEGLTNQEIATQRQVSVRTVERKLQLIRRIWEDSDNENSDNDD